MRVGTDIVEVSRVKTAIERTGRAFLERVYTETEIGYCELGKSKRKYESYAARFAAKEAFSKAIGTGIGENAHLNEIEVLYLDNGKPVVRLYGETKAYFEANFSGKEIDISLSHTSKLALATVVVG